MCTYNILCSKDTIMINNIIAKFLLEENSKKETIFRKVTLSYRYLYETVPLDFSKCAVVGHNGPHITPTLCGRCTATSAYR